MFTVVAVGGPGWGLRSRRDCRSELTEAPSGMRVVNDDSTANASPGCRLLAPSRSQKSPHTSSEIG
jgi:hypothetical protein